jgi:hypothetical protein
VARLLLLGCITIRRLLVCRQPYLGVTKEPLTAAIQHHAGRWSAARMVAAPAHQ